MPQRLPFGIFNKSPLEVIKNTRTGCAPLKVLSVLFRFRFW